MRLVWRGGIVVIVLVAVMQGPAFSAAIQWDSLAKIEQRFDDNVSLDEKGQTSDYITLLTSSVAVSSSSQRLKTSLRYTPQFEWFKHRDDLNTVRHAAAIEAVVQPSQEKEIRLGSQFNFTPDSTEIKFDGVAVPRGDVFANSNDLSLIFSDLAISYRRQQQAYEAAGLSDSVSHSVTETLEIPLPMRFSIEQRYRMSYFIQDSEAMLRSHSLGMGLTYMFLQNLSASTGAGVTYWRGFEDDSFRVGSMFWMDIEKRWNRGSIILSFSRDAQAEFSTRAEYKWKKATMRANFSKELAIGGGVLNDSVDRRRTGLQLEYQLGRHMGFSLEGGYGASRVLSGGRTRFDSYWAGAGLTNTLSNWVNLGLHYNYSSQDSPGAQPGTPGVFRRNQAMLMLSAVLS